MQAENATAQVRDVLKRFQDGYTARDLSLLDRFMELFVRESEELDADGRLVEATHFGMRRVRERHKGMGHAWPFVLTAVLVRVAGQWRFHTIHWSMPVD